MRIDPQRDAKHIRRIGDRYAQNIETSKAPYVSPKIIKLVLVSVQSYGPPLDLESLANSDDAELMADLRGILRYYDLESCQFRGGFTPLHTLGS